LIQRTPDVLWTHSPPAAQATTQATTTLPIVVGVRSNLVAQGLAAGLAHPGGNLTGFALRDIELTGKRLELLTAAVPAIARVAILVAPTIRAHDDVPSTLAPEALTLGVQLQRVAADTPEAFEDAFAAMGQGRAEARMIMDVPVFARNRHRLFALARLHRLPTVSGTRFFAEAGSLLAYGANV
jgi:putative tryptophan/tyrosine transport system substrate-binding protein